MTLCINPHCPNPNNSDNERFCRSCGSELLLNGHYQVMRRLGGGGFGVTYEVNDTCNSVTKVIKVLINNQQKAIELFQQEAQVLQNLNHPGIPKVESDGYFVFFPRESKEPVHCLVMEKIVGIDLEKWMQNRGMSPIDQDLMMQWLRELVTILHQVHTQKFFHRDIKPPNIMLTADGRLSLIDFGTVREITETYQVKVGAVGNVTGIVSAGYTPPEQINYHAEPRSDFFALGRTFVYLLTGKHPLDQDIYDPRSDELRWSSQAPNISPLIVDLLDDMMAHKPTERPEDTQAILQRIDQIEASLQTGRYVYKFPRFRPGMEFPKTEAKFLRQWTLVTAIGLTIGTGFALFTLGLYNLIKESSKINWITSFFLTISFSFIFGSAFGLLQWLVLRKWLYQTRWWIFTNGLDATISSTLFWLVASLPPALANDSVPFFYFPFILLPLIQYTFIRKNIQSPFAFFWFFSHPVSWIVAPIIASIIFAIIGIVGTLLYHLFSFTLKTDILGNILATLIATLTGFIAFACYGFLTGMALTSMLKSPRKNK